MKKLLTMTAALCLFAAPVYATGNGNNNGANQDHTCQGGHNCNGGGSVTNDLTIKYNPTLTNKNYNTNTNVNTNNINNSSSSTSTSSSSANNTNTVTNTATGGDSNSSSSATGGDAKATARGGQGGAGGDSSTNVVVEGNEASASSAYAPALTSGDDTCMGSTSVGGQGVGFGLSLGSTWEDEDCKRRKNARFLHNTGNTGIAITLMCQDDEVFEAVMIAGTKQQRILCKVSRDVEVTSNDIRVVNTQKRNTRRTGGSDFSNLND